MNEKTVEPPKKYRELYEEYIALKEERQRLAIHYSKTFANERQATDFEKLKNKISYFIKYNKSFEETLFLIFNEINRIFRSEICCLLKIGELSREEQSNRVCFFRPETEKKTDFINFMKNSSVEKFFNRISCQIFINDINSTIIEPNVKNIFLNENIKNLLFSPFWAGKNKYGLVVFNSQDVGNNHIALMNDIVIQIESLIKQNKLYSQSEFISSVSHELKTPFTLIRGYAQLLKNNNLSKEEREESLASLVNSVDKLDNIINNLTLLSSIEAILEKDAIKFEIIPLKSLLGYCINFCAKEANRKNIRISIDCPQTDIAVNVDLMKHALINIIDNAIKYSPENTKIEVKAIVGRKKIIIEVADEGIGISKESINKLFERFYRVYSNETSGTKGAGIGLSIVKKVMDLHGASIEVKGRYKKGSRFILYLPKTL